MNGAGRGLLLAAALLAVALDARALAQSPGVHPISGRVYALPMGVSGAEWLDRREREAEEAPTRALQLLRIRPGAVVADVGAGSGYITERLSAIVGPGGHVYANDIQQGMIDLLRRRIAAARLTNVTPILAAPDDPKLPDNSLDLVIMVDVYHELGAPQAVLAHIHRALRADGRLVLIEYRGEDPRIPIRPDHKMTTAQAKLELEAERFRLAEVIDELPRQHILIFTR